jgi:hypothetical protein
VDFDLRLIGQERSESIWAAYIHCYKINTPEEHYSYSYNLHSGPPTLRKSELKIWNKETKEQNLLT